MQLCGDGCIDACDWCKHFCWEAWLCLLTMEETTPGSSCDSFYCDKADDVNNKKEPYG